MVKRICTLLKSIPEEAQCLYCIIYDIEHYIPLVEEEWTENIYMYDFGTKSYLCFCFPLSYITKDKVDINNLSTLIDPKLLFILKWDDTASIRYIDEAGPRVIRTRNDDKNITIYSFNL